MNATATISDQVEVKLSNRDGDRWLTINLPNGWDSCKQICKRALICNGESYVFRGWNSDRNEAFFQQTSENLVTVPKNF